MEFEFPQSKKDWEALSIADKNMLTYLFGKRVLQATEELKNFGFSMWLNLPKEFNQEIIEECFRVLSYTPLRSFYIDVQEEYIKALQITTTKVQATRVGIVSLFVAGLGIFLGVINPLKLLGG